jgi:hypothetical protein
MKGLIEKGHATSHADGPGGAFDVFVVVVALETGGEFGGVVVVVIIAPKSGPEFGVVVVVATEKGCVMIFRSTLW